MTTLKTYHADEIAMAFAAQMKDEGFVGMYRTAKQYQPWVKGPASKLFQDRADAIKTEQERDAVLDMLNDPDFKTKLGAEKVADETELQNYVLQKKLPVAAKSDDEPAQMAKDEGGCPQHAEAKDGCPECADASVAVAIDFAIRHMVKIADALDKTGFVGVAGVIDETLQKLAANRPFVVRAARSYKGWVSFLKKKSPAAAEKFKKTYKGALEHAKEKKGLGAEKAEEYAMRTALDGVPKSYLKEPTPEHGKGKSGPLVAKKAADGVADLRTQFEEETRGEGIRPPDPKADPELYNRMFRTWLKSKGYPEWLARGETRRPAPAAAKPEAGTLHPSFPKLTDEVAGMWYGLPDQMKEQVLPNWTRLSKEDLAFQLSGAEVQKRLRSRYEQWNRMQLGQETPPPQAGKRPGPRASKLVQQVQRIIGTKPDGLWGRNTTEAWNTYVKRLNDPYWAKMGTTVKPSDETLRQFLNFAKPQAVGTPDQYAEFDKYLAERGREDIKTKFPQEYQERFLAWRRQQPAGK